MIINNGSGGSYSNVNILVKIFGRHWRITNYPIKYHSYIKIKYIAFLLISIGVIVVVVVVVDSDSIALFLPVKLSEELHLLLAFNRNNCGRIWLMEENFLILNFTSIQILNFTYFLHIHLDLDNYCLKQ